MIEESKKNKQHKMKKRKEYQTIQKRDREGEYGQQQDLDITKGGQGGMYWEKEARKCRV